MSLRGLAIGAGPIHWDLPSNSPIANKDIVNSFVRFETPHQHWPLLQTNTELLHPNPS